MKKDKGFTLIEVLATLIILSIIGLIITPIITNLIAESRKTISKEQMAIILRSAEKWAVGNVDILPLVDNKTCVLPLSGANSLKKSGYYEDKEIVDPMGGNLNGFIYLTYKEESYDYDIVYKKNDTANCRCTDKKSCDVIIDDIE